MHLNIQLKKQKEVLKNMMNYNSEVELFQIDFEIQKINEFKQKINNTKYTYPILESPVLYILVNDTNIYIGETTNIITRLKNHKNSTDKKMLETAYIFSAEYFNQSLVENLESIVLNLFSKDVTINIQTPSVETFHNYYEKTKLLKMTLGGIKVHLERIFPSIKLENSFLDAIQNSELNTANTFTTPSVIDFEFNQKNIKKYTEGSENYPCVYLLRSDKKIYVGETADIQGRLLEHKGCSSKKIFTTVSLITFNKFNNSATYDLETSLLNYFLADEKYIVHNEKQQDTKIVYNYFNQIYYHTEVFNMIWKILQERQIVKHSIEQLKTKDIFKISPFIFLTDEQDILKDKILSSIKENTQQRELFIIKGEAGSGKSVLISSLYNSILDLYEVDKEYNKKNYVLVNHDEMLKTYKLMARYIPLLVNKNIMKPTSFINTAVTEINPAHITIIDEGHTLLSSSDNYNGFPFDNHLEEIIKRSTKVILVFDEMQFLKLKSYWDNNALEKLKEKAQTLYPDYLIHEDVLKNQLRMVCSQNILDWINSFVEERKIEPLPPIDNEFEFKIFDDCSKMYQELKKRNQDFKLSRLVSTFDYNHSKTKGVVSYIEEGDLKLPWNVIEKEAWAQREETIDEIGSIYTIQGFDLNYAGIIIGPSISYDEGLKKLKIDISKYKDSEAFKITGKVKELSPENIIRLKEKIILNSLNVLMKRPIKGLYIYASDKHLRKYLTTLT